MRYNYTTIVIKNSRPKGEDNYNKVIKEIVF